MRRKIYQKRLNSLNKLVLVLLKDAKFNVKTQNPLSRRKMTLNTKYVKKFKKKNLKFFK